MFIFIESIEYNNTIHTDEWKYLNFQFCILFTASHKIGNVKIFYFGTWSKNCDIQTDLYRKEMSFGTLLLFLALWCQTIVHASHNCFYQFRNHHTIDVNEICNGFGHSRLVNVARWHTPNWQHHIIFIIILF